MRALTRQALISGLAGFGITEDSVVSGGADSIQERPFINLQWSETNPRMAQVVQRAVVIWVHDEPADYTRIDAILRNIRSILAALQGVEHETGWVLEARWLSESSDLRDPDRGTIFRQATYMMVGSGM